MTGALVGLTLAIPALAMGLTPASPGWVLAIAGAGVGLDALRLAAGRPGPPTSGRQVPQEWSRFFDPVVVAVLYGGRLGVGPLTILSTWTWWSVTIAAAVLGPWSGAAVAATFGAVRLTVTVAASVLAGGGTDPARHTARFLTLRARQRAGWALVTTLGALAVAVSLVGTAGSGPTLDAAASFERPSPSGEATIQASVTTATTATASGFELPRHDRQPVDPGERVEPPSAPPTIPVRLEDVVRQPGTLTQAPATPSATTNAPATAAIDAAEPSSGTPEALAAAIPAVLDGFAPIDGPAADRFLDLTAAAAIQPDPTEEVALLETRGYRGGWTRAFRSEGNDVAVVSVYQFRDATEAEFYLEDGLITIGGYGGKFFDIPALPGVRGFVQYLTETDGDGTEELASLGAAFHLGPRWYLVYVIGSVSTVTPEVLIPAVAAVQATAGAA